MTQIYFFLKNYSSKFIFTYSILCFISSNVIAQCPGSGNFAGPITIGNNDSCPTIEGMLQWNATTQQFEGYNGTTWVALAEMSSSSSLWSAVGNTTSIFNTDLENVGIGLNNPSSKLHVFEPNININRGAAHKLDFGTQSNGIFTYGILIEGEPLGTSQTGQMEGVVANTYSNHTSQTGWAIGRLATSKSFGADGGFVGTSGVASSSALNNFNNNKVANLLGGNFATNPNMTVTLNGDNFWVGGVKGALSGTINNTPNNGAVAAVIGIDENIGSATSWAGYFEGKGYFSDKVIIGSKDIPAMAGPNNVDFVKLIVTGGLLTEEVFVSPMTSWADYVFEEDFDLKSLEEVETFIKKNGHLPNTPNTNDVVTNGLALKEITVIQQEKIEELFLHSIQLNKENKNLKEENNKLNTRLENLEERLLKLENQ